MGIEDDSTAERRLRLLEREFTGPARHGPVPKAEHTDAARSTPAQPSSHGRSSPPLNLGVIDHIGRSVAEIVQHTRALTPYTGPVPAEAAAVYAWCREQTRGLDDERRAVREAVIYRQGLEHSIAMGDPDVVCPHPCPGCGCWGLQWRRPEQVAVCLNRRCTDSDGMASTWTLAALAHAHIQRQRNLHASAT